MSLMMSDNVSVFDDGSMAKLISTEDDSSASSTFMSMFSNSKNTQFGSVPTRNSGIPSLNILGSKPKPNSAHVDTPKKFQAQNVMLSKDADAMKLFIGQIPKHMDESQLMCVFQLCGPIFDFVIHRDKITGEHQGSAFLVYCSRESATKAIEVFHNKIKFNGMTSPLQVKPARGQTGSKLFVGMISRDTTEETLLRLFEKYGEIEEVHILRDKKTQRGKRCAFVKFRHRTDALEAIAGLRGKMTLPGCSRPMVVKFAHHEYVRDSESNHMAPEVPFSHHSSDIAPPGGDGGASMSTPADMKTFDAHQSSIETSRPISGPTSAGISSNPWSQTCAGAEPISAASAESASPTGGAITRANDAIKLFVGQIPKHMDKADLLPMFEECGSVFDLVVLRHKVNGTHQGSAFLTYCEREAALRAIDKFHNKVKLSGMRSPMQVKPAYGEQEHKLFVGMIPRAATIDDIHKLFGPIGEIEEVYILRDKRTLRSKGCAFVKYRCRANAVAAIATLHGTLGLVGSTRPLVVKFANSRRSNRSNRVQSQNLRAENRDSMLHPFVSPPSNWTGVSSALHRKAVDMAPVFQLQQMLGSVQVGTPKHMYPSNVAMNVFYNPQSMDDLGRKGLSHLWSPNPNAPPAPATSTVAKPTERVGGFVDLIQSVSLTPNNAHTSSFMRAV